MGQWNDSRKYQNGTIAIAKMSSPSPWDRKSKTTTSRWISTTREAKEKTTQWFSIYSDVSDTRRHRQTKGRMIALVRIVRWYSATNGDGQLKGVLESALAERRVTTAWLLSRFVAMRYKSWELATSCWKTYCIMMAAWLLHAMCMGEDTWTHDLEGWSLSFGTQSVS